MNLARRNFFLVAAGALLRADDRPKRDMLVRSARPEDLEMPLSGFSDYITPIEHFFVRTHVYVPTVDVNEWRLKVDGEVATPLTLSMEELKKLPPVELVSVVECAGNGRGFYEPPVPGLQWGNGSVGNGRWRGVRLADVLKRAGVKDSAKEILFDGADVPLGTMPDFQRSIPVKKALDGNTLLAYEMNGETLPVKHGFPLRVVAPGWASDSWAKWLTSIRVLDKEHDGFWMKSAYRHPGKPVAPGTAVPPDQMQPVTSLRVKSVIAAPLDGAQAAVGSPLTIRGVAWSGDAGPVTCSRRERRRRPHLETGGAAPGSANSVRLAAVGIQLDAVSRGVLHDPGAGARRGRQYAAVRPGVEPIGVWLERRPASGRGCGQRAFQHDAACAAIGRASGATRRVQECLPGLS